MGALVFWAALRQQEIPDPAPNLGDKEPQVTPAQTVPRAQPVQSDNQPPNATGQPGTNGSSSDDSTNASQSNSPAPSPNAGQTGSGFSANGSEPHFTTMNEVILDILVGMPQGGGYDASATGNSLRNLRSAIHVEANHLVIESEKAQPSYCSSATYIVFLSALDRINREGHLPISTQVMDKLLVRGQGDGFGVWGRWNANGPGTARLFEELGLGKSFTSLAEARAGDFMKIFWSDQIGSEESGHSVIYLGPGAPNGKGEETILIWSSNIPTGYGRKEVPVSKIKHAVFSRLEDPRKIERVLTLPDKDPYLAALKARPSTISEMLKELNLSEDTTTAPAPAGATLTVESPKSTPISKDLATKHLIPGTPPDHADTKFREDTKNTSPTAVAKDQRKSEVSPTPTGANP
jgi:hypothetical protein